MKPNVNLSKLEMLKLQLMEINLLNEKQLLNLKGQECNFIVKKDVKLIYLGSN